MKYLLGEFDFHFFDISVPCLTRFVYCTQKRSILVAELLLEGEYYAATEEQLADLEAVAMAHSRLAAYDESNILPAWAQQHVITVPVLDEDGEVMSFSLHDVIKGIRATAQDAPESAIDTSLALGLVKTIESLLLKLEGLPDSPSEATSG
jgi:hypothetical protein